MRNYSVDSLKFICAVLIVFLHVPCRFQSYYLPVTRCAVPCFFIISGYFLMGENMQERMKKGSIRMFKLMVESSLLFAIVVFVTHHFEIDSIIPSVEKLIDFVLFNDNPWGFHLWYLGAYLYVLLICILIDKYKKWHVAFMITPILLITDLIMGKYSLLILNREFPFIYVRNFLFVGLPYFLIGAYIKFKDISLRGRLEIAWGG